MARSRPILALIPERRIRARVRALGREIRRDYRGKDLVLVGVLKGSFVFLADLAREIDRPLTIDFLRLSSYPSGTESSGTVRLEFDITQPVKGKDVLLVEDIIDTGGTARSVLRLLRSKRPRSLRLCTLLHKPDRSRIKVPIDYVGFRIPDQFVVGYGLDQDGLHRNLRYLGVLDARGG
jgi:hypoxanthine phosphoribosyltransferase